MADLPRVTSNDFTERMGVIAVQAAVNAARCLWRELERHDVGVDGHIEYVTQEGFATGRLVGVQVKSGPWYFERAMPDSVPFSPEHKHRHYWAEYPLPVILVLHNPITSESLWVDARQQLRTTGVIAVPRANAFDASGVLGALQSSGPLPVGAFDAVITAQRMAVAKGPQGLCFLDLFAQGMTDIANSLYFGMDVVDEILDFLAAHNGLPSFRLGADEYDFIDRYIGFIAAEDLARVDFGSWKQTLEERGMVGTFIAHLTLKGRMVRDAITRADISLPPGEGPASTAIQERFVQMLFNPAGYDEFGQRQARLLKVRSVLESKYMAT